MEFRGEHKLPRKNTLSWGLKAQSEIINDEIKEWHMTDSSGYFLPQTPTVPGEFIPYDDPYRDLIMLNFLQHTNTLQSWRMSGFVQNSWTYGNENTHQFTLIGGVRLAYWTFNKEFIASPRLTMIFKPKWKHHWEFRFKTGFYYQPPFYREMRQSDGTLNDNIKSQRCLQVILASDYHFRMWRRPFKFTTEVYYKNLDKVISYQMNNLMPIYSANNDAKAYVAGVDLKLSGEFVDGLESWVAISLMQTKEKRLFSGAEYLPRPTDQIFMVNLFFQDNFPLVSQFRVHLNFIFASGLPFWAPGDITHEHAFRAPWYRRVDLGFSYMILDPLRDKNLAKNKFSKFVNSLGVYLEVFNVFATNNVAAYDWVKDINNQRWAIPMTLTGRLINLKFMIEF
jgi:outer membrane receptor protein involved in Fe transport